MTDETQMISVPCPVCDGQGYNYVGQGVEMHPERCPACHGKLSLEVEIPRVLREKLAESERVRTETLHGAMRQGSELRARITELETELSRVPGRCDPGAAPGRVKVKCEGCSAGCHRCDYTGYHYATLA